MNLQYGKTSKNVIKPKCITKQAFILGQVIVGVSLVLLVLEISLISDEASVFSYKKARYLHQKASCLKYSNRQDLCR